MKKHGAHHRMNQSCQAVSEEIRETTKKAKEAEEAAKTTETQSKVSAIPVLSIWKGLCFKIMQPHVENYFVPGD